MIQIQAVIAALFIDFCTHFKSNAVELSYGSLADNKMREDLHLMCPAGHNYLVSLVYEKGFFTIYCWDKNQLNNNIFKPLITLYLASTVKVVSGRKFHSFQLALSVASGKINGELNEIMHILFSLFIKYRALEAKTDFFLTKNEELKYDFEVEIRKIFMTLHDSETYNAFCLSSVSLTPKDRMPMNTIIHSYN